MLVRRQVLADASGMQRIRGALVDDVARGRLLKRPPVGARCWLGFSTDVVSRRPYPRLGELWRMVTRSAYYQLRYSPLLLAGTIVGLLWLYLLPPVAALTGLIGAAAGGGSPAWWCAGAGPAGSRRLCAGRLRPLRAVPPSPPPSPGPPRARPL